jgi:hypothetical protein
MTDWFIATEGVKVVKDSASLWPQILVGVLTAGAAFGSVWHGQKRVAQLKQEAAAAKVTRERLLVASELVFILEQFAEGCVRVTTDQGCLNRDRIAVPETTVPKLSYAAVTGDWRVLPAKLRYRIRELPVIQGEADRTIAAAEAHPPDYDAFFEARQYQYTRLGLKAFIQSRRLRQFAGLPDTRPGASPCPAQNVLWNAWRQERKRRHVHAMRKGSDFPEDGNSE